jgi:hypothetical protein
LKAFGFDVAHRCPPSRTSGPISTSRDELTRVVPAPPLEHGAPAVAFCVLAAGGFSFCVLAAGGD